MIDDCGYLRYAYCLKTSHVIKRSIRSDLQCETNCKYIMKSCPWHSIFCDRQCFDQSSCRVEFVQKIWFKSMSASETFENIVTLYVLFNNNSHYRRRLAFTIVKRIQAVEHGHPRATQCNHVTMVVGLLSRWSSASRPSSTDTRAYNAV